MKVVLETDIVHEGGPRSHAMRELEVDFAPSLDWHFNVPPYSPGKLPSRISYVVDHGHFSVYLGLEIIETAESCIIRTDEFKAHGWDVSVKNWPIMTEDVK